MAGVGGILASFLNESPWLGYKGPSIRFRPGQERGSGSFSILQLERYPSTETPFSPDLKFLKVVLVCCPGQTPTTSFKGCWTRCAASKLKTCIARIGHIHHQRAKPQNDACWPKHGSACVCMSPTSSAMPDLRATCHTCEIRLSWFTNLGVAAVTGVRHVFDRCRIVCGSASDFLPIL